MKMQRHLATELCEAVRASDGRSVERLISDGADVNEVGDTVAKATPLWLAVNAAGQEVSPGWDELCGMLSDLVPGVQQRDCASKRNEQIRIIEALIRAGAHPNTPCHGSTPLRGAVYRQDLEVVKLLLANGANANAETFSILNKLARKEGRNSSPGYWGTVLHEAVEEGSLSIVESLLAAGADPGRLDHRGRTPLAIAQEKGFSELGRLLTCGTSVQAPCMPDDAWRAAGEGRMIDLQRLIAAGTSVDAKGEDNATPLHRAAAAGNLAVVEWLVQHGAALDPRAWSSASEQQGATPLHEAILGGRTETARLLITHGANVSAKMSDGSTPLHLAAGEGNEHLVELLVEHGAKPEAQARGGCTPFVLAMTAGHLQVAGFLLRHGADPNRRMEPFDCTALMLVSGQKLRAAVDFLLESGADAALRDARGQNALHHAVSGAAADQVVEIGPAVDVPEGSAEDAVAVVERLLDAGADPAARDEEGKTPLAYARELRLARIVSVLERTGRKRLK